MAQLEEQTKGRGFDSHCGQAKLWGDRGAELGRLGVEGGREARGDGAGCGSHARAGGGENEGHSVF